MFRLRDEAAYMEMMAERGARFQRGAQVVDTACPRQARGELCACYLSAGAVCPFATSTSGGGVRDGSRSPATPAGGDRTRAVSSNDAQPPGPLTFAHVVEPASKYHNVRTGGYASKREARRASVLRNREARGEITDLQEQVPFLLVPKAMDEAGKVIERAATYIADFVYRENGERVCEDCKGMRTDIYILKRKLMLMVHGIRIRET